MGSLPDAVVIVEVPSLRVLFANRYAETATETTFGRPANLDLNELEGEVLHVDGQRYEREQWPIMRASRGEKVSEEECVYRLADGRSITFRISSAPIFDSDGRVIAAVAVGRDVSAQEGGDSASLRSGL